MMHLSPIVAGIFARRHGGDETFVKQVGFVDYYFGANGYRHKMGLVQSLPVPGPLLMSKMVPRLPGLVVRLLRQRMLPLAGIVEDLPDPANRVSCDSEGRPPAAPLRPLRSRTRAASGPAHGVHPQELPVRCCCVTTQRFASDEHVAHQCGTLRFGKDPVHAVLGPDCRFFKHPNVFAVDGSFFPTSLGVGPALTIMANALRVAGIVTREI